MGEKTQGNSGVKACKIDGCWGECPTHAPAQTGINWTNVTYGQIAPGKGIYPKAEMPWQSFANYLTTPSTKELKDSFISDLKQDWSITLDKLQKAYAVATASTGIEPSVLVVSHSVYHKLKQILQSQQVYTSEPDKVGMAMKFANANVVVDKNQLDGDWFFTSKPKK